MSRGYYNYPVGRGVVPCECGSTEPYWHGPEAGLRVYCCDACWARNPSNFDHPAPVNDCECAVCTLAGEVARLTDRPLAVSGLTSYRYRGRYGWIMIGAKNTEDALREAARSTPEDVTITQLEVWTGDAYQPAAVPL